jgi:MFS family permease
MTAHVEARANTYQFIIVFFVGLGSFTYCFDSAIVGSVIGLPSIYSYFNFEYTSSYGSSIIGANNGVYTGGGAIGCWFVNWLSDKLGRRLAIQIIAAICTVSAALQTGSVHIAMFLVGRFLNGVGVGMINCMVPTYISEIAPAA